MRDEDRDRLSAAVEWLKDQAKRVREAIATGDESLLTSARDRACFALELVRSGEWERGERAAFAIDDPEERLETLALAAREIAKKDPFHGGALLRLVPDDPAYPGPLHEKVEALVRIAEAFAVRKEIESCNQAAQEALISLEILMQSPESPPWAEPQYLLDLGKALYGISDQKTAVELWQRAAERALDCIYDIDCEKLLGSIAVTFAETGDCHQAERLLQSVTSETWRQRIITALQQDRNSI
jgi:tetratricopeptide (TPR) repeat protein